MWTLHKLKKASSRHDIAFLLGYKPNTLSYILYKIPNQDKYFEFPILKNDGSERIIKAPTEKLKILQKHLSVLISQCYLEIFDKNSTKNSISHGFRHNHSIITNANKHKNKRYVFNIDLQDFFPSINFGRVRGFFIKNNHFKLNDKVATIIAQISCHDNELPQGSPSSPIISNLIGHLLDIRMVNLSKKSKCTYSRYADDLTFSTNAKNFPDIIAIKKPESINEWIPSNKLIKEVEKVGFSINEKKTSLQYKTSRQITTGLVVNKKVNIKKEYYRNARAMCNELFSKNKFYFLNDETEPKIIYGTINQLEGILSFIYNVKKHYNTQNKDAKRYKPEGIIKLYKKFLFYKHFFSLSQPLIVCEGKSDIIYLKCALKHLANQYTEFIQENDKNFKMNIRFLNMSQTLKEIFVISEGTSGLKILMDYYENNMKSFKGEGKNHPVILLVDNDKGSKIIKNKLNVNDSTEFFYHFVSNLYVVFIPSDKGKETAIEDLFDKKTLEITLNDKQFSRASKIDTKKEYTKTVFADKVIKANQNAIDFNNFKKIFNQFKLVIEDYNKKKNAKITII